MIIGIIGGGASGMMAALRASQNINNQILLFERQARLGRKLLATGNGRCNLTNQNTDFSHYHGEDPAFVHQVFEQFDKDRTLSLFRSLGLYTVSEPSGRVYPYSDQANSVLDVLRFSLQKENVDILTGAEVTRVKKTETGFCICVGQTQYFCDRLIVACGGLAGTKLGGTMSGYQILRSFGHKVTKLRPALVQLKSSWSGCPSLKGVRANCRVRIYHNDRIHAESAGELQFTEYGLSGPVIFEVSRDVCIGNGWTCNLDFLPYLDSDTLLIALSERKQSPLLAEDLLTGILHNRLGRVLVAAVGIRSQTPVAHLTQTQLLDVCRIVKNFQLPLTETLGMDSAQVTAGGVLTADFDAMTMESRLVPGLYACGEVLDIDGDCGGYNLQWAWSSGYIAGSCASEVAI